MLKGLLAFGRVSERVSLIINAVITTIVLIADCILPDGVSVNILYTIVIILAAYAPSPKACFGWAAASTVASMVSPMIAPASIGALWESIDRALTIVCLWMVAWVVYGLRTSHEEAVAERGRAVEALEAKGRFLAAASHDLRQPVQSLILLTAALKPRLHGHSAAPLADALGAVADALKGLLDAVLDISKFAAGVVTAETTSFAIGEMIERIAREFAPRATAKGLRLHTVDTSLWVHSDQTLVERILRNLIENAVRYTNVGGVVIGVRRRASEVRLDVIDSGPGISASDIPRIFEEFHQLANAARARAKGHGLGLAIVRHAARLLDRPVEVASTLGRGTRFSLSLPSAEAPPKSAPTALKAPPIHPELPVLVVEDDPMVLLALKIALEDLGCRVMAAGSPADALSQAHERPPAMILSDFRLPDGDGLEAIALVRTAVGRDIPALMITGDLDSAIESRTRAMGVILLRKPIRSDELARVVASIGR